MSAIFASFLMNTIKFVCFIAIAYAGVLCGKKFKDKKEAQKGN